MVQLEQMTKLIKFNSTNNIYTVSSHSDFKTFQLHKLYKTLIFHALNPRQYQNHKQNLVYIQSQTKKQLKNMHHDDVMPAYFHLLIISRPNISPDEILRCLIKSQQVDYSNNYCCNSII